jgi:hypothetical protein
LSFSQSENHKCARSITERRTLPANSGDWSTSLMSTSSRFRAEFSMSSDARATRVSSARRSPSGSSGSSEKPDSAALMACSIAASRTSCLLRKCAYSDPEPGDRPAAFSIWATEVPRKPRSANSCSAQATIRSRVGS